ncbi:DNA mismatch repair protein MutS [Candidatus Aerophobetes bacterium]|uniref:DNA mismatch repair protein MutS n=1 Tax=Aerophobetes bacterium TaxID=2030807 RepID=A0A2A4X5S9_UNCAE|nr:MAG: DNA mismatch repair protein MutS [Candidatus Aerophobetes bacterium]
MKGKGDTPMMGQWKECKQQAPGALLLFRLGDFYEAFHEDAELLSKATGITLTKRGNILMSGVPVQSLDTYLPKLVDQGILVAIAEQTPPTDETQKIMGRKVVRTVSSGTALSSDLLDAKKSNYFASIHVLNQTVGLAFLEMTTRQLLVTELPKGSDCLREIAQRAPKEFLLSKQTRKELSSFFETYTQTCRENVKDAWYFDLKESSELYQSIRNQERDPLYGKSAAVIATGALIKYLQEQMHAPADFAANLTYFSQENEMKLDSLTIDHLDIDIKKARGKHSLSLIEHLDFTKTPMGGRLFRELVLKPLVNVEAIHEKHSAIDNLLTDPPLTSRLEQLLKQINDTERLSVRISLRQGGAKDLLALATSLTIFPQVKALLANAIAPLLQKGFYALPDSIPLALHITKALVDDPPAKVGDKRTIRIGFNQELDTYYNLKENSQAKLLQMQEELKESTGIKTLKLVFSKTFGYCIEVSKGATHLVPDFLERRQTLVNAERYTYKALKEFEDKLLHADDNIMACEKRLLVDLAIQVSEQVSTLCSFSQVIARIDTLLSLALAAKTYRYTKPLVDNSKILRIQEGRHPLLEKKLLAETFIANDVYLDPSVEQTRIITGPNMAGKSTYIRQVALLTIMAQIGSYIPCKEAHIGIVDQVFTRIGASDNLMLGDSTFMVEMKETAHILHHATSRSLVILDEIGRGTSTYDGIAIAKAVVEYLLEIEGEGVKTLFATHYSELCALSAQHTRVKNYSVAAKVSGDHITFLHKLIKGPASKSYGVHVAKLAGLPEPVIKAANTYLKHLEDIAPHSKSASPFKKQEKSGDQMELFN